MAYTTVTLADLQSLLRQRYDQTPYWTGAEATRAINDALRLWNLFTGYWKRRIVVPTVANQVWYPVPGTLVMPLRMTWELFPLDQGSLPEWDNGRPGWQTDTTYSFGAVPTRPYAFAPAGLSLFAIWPADAAGLGSLQIDGVRNTPVVTLPNDTVDLGSELIGLLLGEALHALSFKEGAQRFAATFVLHQQFLAAAAMENDQLATATVFRDALGADRMPSERMLRGAVTPAATPPQVPQGAQQ